MQRQRLTLLFIIHVLYHLCTFYEESIYIITVFISDRSEYQEYFLGDKSSQCLGLTTLPPSCADCLEIWEPQTPGILGACLSLHRDSFTLYCVYVPIYRFCISYMRDPKLHMEFQSLLFFIDTQSPAASHHRRSKIFCP
jgi:hypothetical protein